MYGPSGVFSDGTKLYVADSNNHRVLVWNTMPSSTGQSASFALGQSNLTSNASATTASGMNFPSSVHHNGTKLFVGDSSNNRVLVWNTIPTASGTAANFALGQANLTTGTQNTGGISASRMAAPRSVLSVGTMLFVSDTDNHRILVWNTIPSTSGEAASFALGQPNLTSNTSNNGGLSSSTLSAPYDVYSEGTKVFIADRGNQRVLVWSALPTASGQAATSVIGQPTFTSATPNNGGLSSSALNYPSYVFANSSNLFIADNANDRVLVLPVP